MDLKSLLETNLLPLAFLGDSVHTLFVRNRVLSNSLSPLSSIHSLAASYCKAESQARALKELLPSLTPDEEEIVRRGRNAKSKHQAKNASSADYSYATAFEALIGYLYAKDDKDRLQEILEKSCQIVEKKQKIKLKG